MEHRPSIPDDAIDPALLREVPLGFARNNGILPLRRHNGGLLAAIADERGILALSDLAKRLGLNPIPLFVRETALTDALNRAYGRLGSAEEVMDNLSGEDLTQVANEFERPRDILELTEDAPIIRLLNALFLQAIKDRASDIHIEPYEKEIEVRMRTDGLLRTVLSPPKIIQDALISRVKIMANLDIAEKRLPQDGRIRLLIGGKDIDIRVSIIPTTYGERAVLRLLDRRQGMISLDMIGLEGTQASLFTRFLARTSGIILVTGPTGSGKTTTLYAALNRIHTEEKNIITIEDPVEYQLRGIGQIQVNPRIGLTFASGLRSILRQDPDVIMVGEIRDYETVEIAVQASLTGHLVLSTLHTNDAPSALTRLIDIGVEPFLISSSLVGVVAQRLVRTLCPRCREPFSPDAEVRRYLEGSAFPATEGVLTLYRARGCDQCRESGYLGRTGIFEILGLDDTMRRMITAKSDAQALKDYAVSQGMLTLYHDGLTKVTRGTTTMEEVLRVTQKDVLD